MKREPISPPSEENHSRWGFYFLLILFLAFGTNLSAGVLVAPTVVFLSDHSRTGRLDVNNPTNAPKEISVYMSFGLPESDSLGNLSVVLADSGVTDPRSALNWIKPFPRKLILAPNSTQVIRLVASPPPGLAPGEYWARIVIKSQEGETIIPTAVDSGVITTRLNMIMQTAIMLKYRTGELSSRLVLTSAQAHQNDSEVVLLADLHNTGNASYVGMFVCRLLDADKKELARAQTELAVYREQRRRMQLPLRNAGKMPYQVELAISTEGRTDIAPQDIIPGNKVQTLVAVTE